MIKYIKNLLLTAVLFAGLLAPSALAVDMTTGQNTTGTQTTQQTAPTGPAKCGDTTTQLIDCDSETGLGTINDLIRIGVFVLSVLIGITALGGFAYAAILYSSARDDQNQVNNARTIIRNIVIGLLLYGFTLAIINWLLPGSVIDAPESQESSETSGTPESSGTPEATNAPES